MKIVEIPVDLKVRKLLEDHNNRVLRRQRVLVARKFVPWNIRKYKPLVAREVIDSIQAQIKEQARSYMGLQNAG